MNIYKLLGGVLLMNVLVVGAPYILVPSLTEKAWLILIVTTVGLTVKCVVGDVVAGEFLFHKFGYDNCVMTFGAALTAVALQLAAGTDLFPGLSSVVLLRDIPAISANPLANRSVQLLVFLLLALAGTLITGAISAAIKKTVARGPDFLSLLNTVLGLSLLGLYVLMLVTKG